MKNNTKLKIAHQLGSNLQVGSIKPVEELNEISIFPTKYDVGKNVVINEADNTIYEVRSLYVPDNFIENISIAPSINDSQHKELLVHYQAIYEEMLDDLVTTQQENDTIYSLHDVAKDLGLYIKEAEQKKEITQEEDITPIKKAPANSIAKAIQAKKNKKSELSSSDEDNFLKSLK